ncbi:MAG: ABC transporter substrate-binding protein [Bacillota bacterium]
MADEAFPSTGGPGGLSAGARRVRSAARAAAARTLAALALTGLVTLAVALAGAGFLQGCAPAGLGYGPAGEPQGRREPVRLRFTIESDDAHADIAATLAEQFAGLGARVTVRVLARSEIVARARAGDGDAWLVGWSGLSPDPLGFAACKLCSSGAENLSGYANPEVDRLLAGLVLRFEAAERELLARAAQEILREEAPWVFGFSRPLYDAGRSTLSGWVPGPAGAVCLRAATTTAADGRVVVGLGLGEPPVLDPLSPIDPQAGVVFRCLFDSLVSPGTEGSLQPGLAASWEWSSNRRHLLITLRGGVTFHDGQPLRPGDVVFTYQTILPGRLPPGVTVEVKEAEGGAVVFSFSAPFPQFLEVHGLQPIVPEAVYERLGADGFAAAPVGTGPFRLDPERGARHLVLYRWESYHEWSSTGPVGKAFTPGPGARDPGTSGVPVKEIAFTLVPDVDRRAAMLRAGQIALAPALPVGVARDLEGEPGLTVAREPGVSVIVLELNNRRPPFDDARVRLALNQAVDRAALILVLGPGAEVLPTAFLRSGSGFAASIAAHGPDLAGARNLLVEAGYVVSEP